MTEHALRPVPERKRGSGAKMVYDLLRDEILDLVLPPGSPVDEMQLAERFRISRTPVREALVRLAGEGLIETLAEPVDDGFEHRLPEHAALVRRDGADVPGDRPAGGAASPPGGSAGHSRAPGRLRRGGAGAGRAGDDLHQRGLSRRHRRSGPQPLFLRTVQPARWTRAGGCCGSTTGPTRTGCRRRSSTSTTSMIAAIAARDVEAADRLGEGARRADRPADPAALHPGGAAGHRAVTRRARPDPSGHATASSPRASSRSSFASSAGGQADALRLGFRPRGEAALRGQARALTGDRLEQRLGPGEGIAGTTGGEGLRREGDEELAMRRRERGAAEMLERLRTGQVADHHPGQKLDHGADRRALVAAEGQHRSGQRRRRIGRGRGRRRRSPSPRAAACRPGGAARPRRAP